MTWTTLSWAFGNVLTSADMNALYADFAAFANGDSGAPSVVKAALAADSVSFNTQVDSTITDSTLNCSSSAYQNVPAGVVYLYCTAGSAYVEIYANATWNRITTITTSAHWFVVSDAANVRVGGVSGTNTVAYRRVYQ